jgi:nucleoside-diphosphate-sugar epimerase
MRDLSADPLAAFRRANTEATRRLGEAARRAGVGRLVFVSSIKAQTEATPTAPATDADPARPIEPYGVSKLEAEAALAELVSPRGLAVGILRPPLLYGPGVKGNFLKLMGLVDRGLPLPLGAIRNRRSLLHVGNLADAILNLLAGDPPAPRPYLIQDGTTLSTPALIRAIATALNRPARLVPVPPGLLGGAAAMLGKGAAWRRLAGSLVVDDARLRRERGWIPPVQPEAGLVETVRWYRSSR